MGKESIGAADGAARVGPVEVLTGAEANAIVRAAERALYQTRFAGNEGWDGVTLRPEWWGPALAGLKPVRDWQHNGNIVIVLSVGSDGQAGWYGKPASSSYMPWDLSEVVFEPMVSVGEGCGGRV